MPKRPYSLQIKNRFVQAVELIAKENYPGKKEVEIVQTVGFTPSNYYRMRNSDKNYPTLDNCALLCEKYNISEIWLISGKGHMRSVEGKKLSGLDLIKEGVRMLEKKK